MGCGMSKRISVEDRHPSVVKPARDKGQSKEPESTKTSQNDSKATSFDDLDAEDLKEIAKHLSNVSFTEIAQTPTLYKLALIHAVRGLHWKFMKKMALSGVGMRDSYSISQEKTRNDISKALEKSDFDLLQKLLEKANTIDAVMKDKSGYDVIASMLLCSCPVECFDFVIGLMPTLDGDVNGSKCVLNGFDSNGLTPLMSAVLSGNLRCLQSLLEKGADVDLVSSCVTSNGAVSGGAEMKTSAAKEVEEKSFSKDPLYNPSKTALMYAVCADKPECVEILLRFKADISKKVGDHTALSYAAITSNYTCLNLLLTKPVQLNRRNQMGDAVRKDLENSSKSDDNVLLLSDDFDLTKSAKDNSVKPKIVLSSRAKYLRRRSQCPEKDGNGTKDSSSPKTKEPEKTLGSDHKVATPKTLGSDRKVATPKTLGSDRKIATPSRGQRQKSASGSSTIKTSVQEPTVFEVSDNLKPAQQNGDKEKQMSSEENKAWTDFCQNFEPKFTIGCGSKKRNMHGDKPRSITRQNGVKPKKPDIFKKIHYLYSERNVDDVRVSAEACLPLVVMGDDIRCLEILLSYCGFTGCLDKHGKTPLILSAQRGKVDYVELLLKNWAGTDYPVSMVEQETALMVAARNGHEDCVRTLLQYKAKLESSNWNKETALMCAARNGTVGCVKILLEHKSDVDAVNAKGQTALIIAAENERTECIELLLESGSKASQFDWYGKSALAYAAKSGNDVGLDVLLKALVKENHDNNKSLADRAEKDPTDSNIDLEESGGRTDSKENESKTISDEIKLNEVTPLNNDVQSLPVLNGPVCNRDSDTGAVKKKSTTGQEIKEETKDKKEEQDTVDIVNSLAEKSLPYSARGRNINCFDMLVRHCRSFDQTEFMGSKTTLMIAVENRLVEWVKRLITLGVDLNFVYEGKGMRLDERGKSAVTSAVLTGNKECLELLLESGADPNKGFDSNLTKRNAMAIALFQGQVDCLKLLVKFGGKAMSSDPKEESAFIIGLDNEKSVMDMVEAGFRIEMNDLYDDHINKLFNCPENLERLLKGGVLVMNEELSNSMGQSPVRIDKDALRCLQLLMEHKVFDWRAWCDDDSIQPILIIAVRLGISPKKFFHRNRGLVSPLQHAILEEREGTLRYLLSNLYFTLDDYRVFTSGFIKDEKISSNWVDSKLLSCFHAPWRLETLCLITVSSSLFDNTDTASSHQSLPRVAQVDSLPIPERFKTILKFERVYSRICVSSWEHIGRSEKDDNLSPDILSVTKSIFPTHAHLKQCDRGWCPFKGTGFHLADSDNSDDSDDYGEDDNDDDNDADDDEYGSNDDSDVSDDTIGRLFGSSTSISS